MLLEIFYIFKHKHKLNINRETILLYQKQPFISGAAVEVGSESNSVMSATLLKMNSFTDIFEDCGHIFPSCFKVSLKFCKQKRLSMRNIITVSTYFFVSSKICYHKTNTENSYKKTRIYWSSASNCTEMSVI